MTSEFSIGVLSVPDYLLVNIIKVRTPSIIDQTLVFGPAPSSFNMVVENLDPENYWMDWRSSVDGIDQGILVTRFLFNAANNQILEEYRYYTGGGGGDYDPAINSSVISDPYLVGKTITAVSKQGFGFLKPVQYWEILNNGDINLLDFAGNIQEEETITVIISYKGNTSTGTSQTGLFSGVYTFTEDTQVEEQHFNSRMNCAAIGTRLTITLPPGNTVPNNTTFYFLSRGGNQRQTTIKAQDGGLIYFDAFKNNYSLEEIWIGKGEHVWLQFIDGYFEVISASSSIARVGMPIVATHLNHEDIIFGDMEKYDGLDYPRIYWYLKNILPANFVHTSANVNADRATYEYELGSLGKFGLFGIDPTPGSTFFRTPRMESMSLRALNNLRDFTGTRPADPELRVFNLPGGYQPSMVGPHFHPYDPGDQAGLSDNANDRNVMIPASPNPTRKTSGMNSGTNNIVDNIGVIFGYLI